MSGRGEGLDHTIMVAALCDEAPQPVSACESTTPTRPMRTSARDPQNITRWIHYPLST
jgi:hypothetical protein